MSAELTAIARLNERFLLDFPHEAARSLEKLPVAGMVEVLGAQSPEAQLASWQALAADRAAEALLALPAAQAAQLLTGAESQVSLRALSQLSAAQRETLLGPLPEAAAAELRGLLQYPAGSAGHLMDPRTGAVNAGLCVDEAIDRLRVNRHRGLRELFVVDDQVKLVGQVELEDLLLTARDRRLREITHAPPLVVRELDRASHIVKQVQLQPVHAVPVVDAQQRLVGVIRQSELMTAARLHSSIDLQTMVAAGAGERALSSAGAAVGHRLSWLLLSLLTVFLASATAGIFEGTLARVTALAVLLPVILGQSRITGSQSLTVVLRGLFLGEVQPRHWLSVAGKEIAAGLLNGVLVSLVAAVGVYLWSHSTSLALVTSGALLVSMMVAGVTGGLLPLLLRAMGRNPARASMLLLTTVSDVVGIFAFLGFATLLLDLQ
ncbi:MAG TPA: magnesium transporter [Steroidobacteraceae bacterium]|nr:magnesium transporter [Steroidobacteraceae bacterium]